MYKREEKKRKEKEMSNDKDKRRVLVGKIDLDTVAACFIAQVTREDEVEVVGCIQVAKEDLENPNILCIGVGGSGRRYLNNWDKGKGSSITRQMWEQGGCNITFPGGTWQVETLIDYIEGSLSVKKPRQKEAKDSQFFPTLLDIFEGMLLSTRGEVEKLHCGVGILRTLVRKGLDPFGLMPEDNIWFDYSQAKARYNREVRKLKKQAQWTTTSSGFSMVSVESDFLKAAYILLHKLGAQIAVVLNPRYRLRSREMRMFTISSNNIELNTLLPELNSQERGWKIIGNGKTLYSSCYRSSGLSLKKVIRVVQKKL